MANIVGFIVSTCSEKKEKEKVAAVDWTRTGEVL